MKTAPSTYAALFALTATTIPTQAHARDIVYESQAYSVYAERPGYCTLYLDTPRGAMIRMADDRAQGQLYFSYVRQGFPAIPTDRSVPILFQFDNDRVMLGTTALGYRAPDGRAGFSLGETALRQRWGDASSVTIRLGDHNQTVIETFSLNGSARAIAALSACAGGVAAPVQEATGSLENRFAARCPGAEHGNIAEYLFDGKVFARGIDCSEYVAPHLAFKSFADGVTIVMVTQANGGMTGTSGALIRLKAGQQPAYVDNIYLLEWSGAISATQFDYVAMGHLRPNQPPEPWSCRIAVNWARRKIVRSTRLSGADMCTAN